jgi:ectonucleotide pyrophosphatase/phosphodiesterase family member 5
MSLGRHVLDRRTFLRGSAVVGGTLVAGTLPSGIWARRADADDDWVRAVVVVVDGLRPDQVASMPILGELAAEGTSYPWSRAHMVAETTPNHLCMLTGMLTQRHGMPGNAVPGLEDRVSDDRRYLKADSVFTTMARQAPELFGAAVTAKTYIVESTKHDRTGDGDEDADHTNDPTPAQIPSDESARDAEIAALTLEVMREEDPDFLFVNLGDVDRAGHIDESGGLIAPTPLDGTQPAFQAIALAQADAAVRSFVEELRSSGRWERTVFIVTADHSMDWSSRTEMVDLASEFEADDLLRDEVVTAVNGGACLYALRSPDDPRAHERLRRMRAIALAAEGVREALYIRPNRRDGEEQHWVGRLHPEWGLLGDYTGDLIVTVERGWRIGHDGVDSNPIPGNHGHPTTLPIPVIVSGGWDGIRHGHVVEASGDPDVTDVPAEQAGNIDVAPTVAWLLGLHPPPGGYDGRVLGEAFTRRPSSRATVRNVVPMPILDRIGDDDPYRTSVALSREALPDGYDDSRPPGAQPITTGNEGLDDVVVGQLPVPDERIVVLASGEEPTTALTAGPLAARFGAPLLLSDRDRLPDVVADEVARLGPDRALLIGDQDALSEEVAGDVRAAGVPEVERIAGEDAAATAAAVARHMGVNEDTRQVILTSADPALALAAHQVGALRHRPVLLTGPDALPETTRAALDELDIARILIAGGVDVVSEPLAEELRDEYRIVERIAGEDVEQVGRLLAERAVREGAPTDDLYLAPRNPWAALAAGPAVSILRGSLVLVDRERLGAGGSRDFLIDRADEFVRIRFVGPLSEDLGSDVERVIRDQRTRPYETGEADLAPAPQEPVPPDGPSGRRPPGARQPAPAADAGDGPRHALPTTGAGRAALGLGALALAGVLRLRGRTPRG